MTQLVAAAVPVRVLQATLAQLDGSYYAAGRARPPTRCSPEDARAAAAGVGKVAAASSLRSSRS